jgi:hypothetical protein
MAPGHHPASIHIDRALVAAVLARYEQPADAVPAHAAERHGTDWFVILGHGPS